MSQAPPEAEGGRLSGHVEESVEAIAALHRDHYESASALHRAMDAATRILAQPVVVAVALAGIAALIAAALAANGGRVESPAFAWIELAATLAALFIALLILVTQRRQDELAERRDQLTLEVSILSDRKAAKLIELIEELRRDAPDLADRRDPESDEMARPTDTTEVLAAIDRRAPGGKGG